MAHRVAVGKPAGRWGPRGTCHEPGGMRHLAWTRYSCIRIAGHPGQRIKPR
jgi:hypothetical protein